jgi:hypothetical protein
MNIDRHAFLKDLKGMENSLMRDANYNLERGITDLVIKYNLEWIIIRKRIKADLTL